MTDEQKNSSNSPVTVTPRAAEQILKLIKEHARDSQKSVLRVFVHGGGCSGFQYGIQFEDEASNTDTVFESNGIRIAVDPISLRYLKGAQIDLDDNLMGGFNIKNPNAKSTCGCGQSFTA